MVLGQLDSHMQKNEIEAIVKSYIKIDSKWIIDLNVRTKTIKLFKENTGVNLNDLRFGKGFLSMISKAYTTEEEKDQMNFVKIKIFVFQKI